MRELALFSGAGGGILGSYLLGWRTVCAVEIAEYPRRVLLARQRDGILPRFPIWDDIKTFNGKEWRGRVDIVTGGFPCQPFSTAGSKRGEEDKKNLWPETIRVIREIKPRYCFLENSANLINYKYFGRILADLAESGYDAKWKVLSAAELGAPHKRNRVWIFCNSYNKRKSICSINDETSRLPKDVDWWFIDPSDLSYSYGFRWDIIQLERKGIHREECTRRKTQAKDIQNSWRKRQTESKLGRVVDGMADRMDRIAAIGNGQVPAVVRLAWKILGGEGEQ